ncbi:MAG: YhbY family RNA-binding protein [Candidatus Bathyarchaeota archaeon]|nr:YhbY family RNA-binding protein [Candidatus Bathyarchaeum tardum]WGM89348.1 MAG: YhbY family RNA-binding protein [Candidatus Bathyarchaeum tardum]
MLTPKMIRRIKSALSAEKPTVRIGKEGATAEIVGEVEKQLKVREIIKVKILKTALHEQEALEAKNIASTVAQQAEAELVDVRGHTFMLYKSKKKR